MPGHSYRRCLIQYCYCCLGTFCTLGRGEAEGEMLGVRPGLCPCRALGGSRDRSGSAGLRAGWPVSCVLNKLR